MYFICFELLPAAKLKGNVQYFNFLENLLNLQLLTMTLTGQCTCTSFASSYLQ